MIFKDVLLDGGTVADIRYIDTGAIDEEVYLVYARLLGRLRRGFSRAEIEVQGHQLSVSFGSPSFAESIATRIAAPVRRLTVAAGHADMFFVSLLLDVDADPKDEFDCFTILTLSEALPASSPAESTDSRIRALLALRPCLIHAVVCPKIIDSAALSAVRDCSDILAASLLAGY